MSTTLTRPPELSDQAEAVRSRTAPRPPSAPRPPRPPREPRPRSRVTPSTARAAFAGRIRFIRMGVVVAVILIVARLVDVQVLQSSSYRADGAKELTLQLAVPALRGGIYDRNGQVLAMSVPTKTVIADDYQIPHPVAEARILAPLVGAPSATLATELHQRSGYVVVGRQVGETQASKIAADNLPGITLIDSSKRIEPTGTLASPIVGITNGTGAGASGLEYKYNGLLAGRSGSETLVESPLGVQVPATPVRRTLSQPGTGLELSIDEPLQYEAEQALGAEIKSSNALSGTAVVMDVRTGQILAMANLVNAAPSPLGPPVSAGKVAEAASNLALTQVYEPGSVFKLVTFSAALQDGVITPSSVFTVPGQLMLDGSLFHDAEAHPTEQMTATQIIAQSSNIGTSEIAQKLGETRLLAQVKKLGFGLPTGLNFPGDSPGLLATAATWEPTDYVSLPIGQVDAVSAQQVLDAFNAVANGGMFVQPQLVLGTVNSAGSVQKAKVPPAHRVFSPTVDSELTSMLEQVVNVGTGTSAVVPGYAVAGKTGTSQIPTPGKNSYEPGSFMATFVGFAPANNPVLSAIVVLDRPTPIYGGSVAAPVFSQVMSYALHRYGIPSTAGAPSKRPPPSAGSSQQQDVT